MLPGETRVGRWNNFLVADKHVLKFTSITGFVKVVSTKEKMLKNDTGEQVLVDVFKFTIFFDGVRVDFFFEKLEEADLFERDIFSVYGQWINQQ
jgi:hypothetical protein